MPSSPEKPFSGKFPVRVSPALHRAAALAARRRGESLNAFIEYALERETRNARADAEPLGR
jgi:predicted HicB family RNase H-like nuclease